jgi:hypothetical protein
MYRQRSESFLGGIELACHQVYNLAPQSSLVGAEVAQREPGNWPPRSEHLPPLSDGLCESYPKADTDRSVALGSRA